jgi:hypothetical protein
MPHKDARATPPPSIDRERYLEGSPRTSPLRRVTHQPTHTLRLLSSAADSHECGEVANYLLDRWDGLPQGLSPSPESGASRRTYFRHMAARMHGGVTPPLVGNDRAWPHIPSPLIEPTPDVARVHRALGKRSPLLVATPLPIATEHHRVLDSPCKQSSRVGLVAAPADSSPRALKAQAGPAAPELAKRKRHESESAAPCVE